MNYLDFLVRSLLAVVFGVAAAAKLTRRRGFADFVTALVALGLNTGSISVAVTVVALETTAFILLLIPATGYPALILALVLLLSFSAGTGYVLRRGRRVLCRCFGSGGGILGPAHLIRNLTLVFVTIVGLVSHTMAGQVPPVGVAAAAGGGALVGFLFTRWDDLMFLVGVTNTGFR